MVYLSDPTQLNARLEVADAKYDFETKKTELVLSYVASVGNVSVTVQKPMSIPLDKSAVANFEELVNDKRAKLEVALNQIRESIAPLFKVTKYVQVDLKQVAEQLMMEIEKTSKS